MTDAGRRRRRRRSSGRPRRGFGLGERDRDPGDPASRARLRAASDSAFTAGAARTGTGAVLADLFAGWAFLANARKDTTGNTTTNYSDSNAKIDQVFARDAAWAFDPLPALDVDDLRVLKAANHFALTEFDASLAQVQLLDSGFAADVGTPAGRAALAEKIEALREAS